MDQEFVTDDTHTSELERAINELLESDRHAETPREPEPASGGGDELQGLFGAQS